MSTISAEYLQYLLNVSDVCTLPYLVRGQISDFFRYDYTEREVSKINTEMKGNFCHRISEFLEQA